MSVEHPSLYITLGLHLDGAPYPLALHPDEPGRCYGPNGFLGQLEAWLGLPPFEDIAQSQGQRVALCMRAARELCRPRRGRWKAPFYKKSFETAPWATAKRLLFMLDSLLESGWTGEKSVGKDMPPNLVAMKKLHETLGEGEFQSPALRFERLLNALEQHFPLPQDVSVTLLEDRILWPYWWRLLFDKLDPPNDPENRLMPFTQWKMPEASARGDLGHLQHSLQDLLQNYDNGGKLVLEKRDFKGDGTLILLESDTTDQAAEATALLLRQSQTNKDDTLLLLTSDSQALEQGLANFHLPALGATTATSAASLLQVLPAALRLLWTPRSMEALVDFLQLKITPIGMANANTLIKALNKQPGIGTMEWEGSFLKKAEEDRDAWEKAIIIIQDRLKNPQKYYGKGKETGAAEEVDGEKALKKWESICKWCLTNEIHDEKDGISLDTLRAVCERLRLWAHRCRNTPFYKENFPGIGNAFAVLAGQCAELQLRAEFSGNESFSRPLLESMLADLPAPFETTSPQAATWYTAEHPGQLARPHDTLVWWTFAEPAAPRDVRRPWSDDELQWLEANGFLLPDLARQHRLALTDFVRSILLTRQRCVFILPRRQYGESITPSPWLDVVRNCFDFTADNALAMDAVGFLKKLHVCHETEEVTPVIKPDTPKKWRISSCALKDAFTKLKASQLHEYVACPFRTLVEQISYYDQDDFKKKLTFDPAGRRMLPDFPIMLGNFAHFLLQELITKHKKLTPDNAVERMDALIGQHLSAHAAPLDAPDKQSDLAEFRNIMQNAAREIAERMQSRKLTHPRIEIKETQAIKELGNIEIEGRADVLWDTADGQTAIWDLKYSDRSKYRKALENNKAEVWQLTAYQNIFPNVAGVAYWLIKARSFCGSSGSGISDNEIVAAYDAEQSWDNLLAGLKEMQSALNDGTLETAASIAEKVNNAQGDEKKRMGAFFVEKNCKYCGLRFVCGGGYGQK